MMPNYQELASWARLAFAPMGTVCSPSTFCLYPTIASARGFWALDKTNNLFSAAEEVTKSLPSFHVISMPVAVSHKSLHSGHRRKLGGIENSCSNAMGAAAVGKLTREKWLPPVCKGEDEIGKGRHVVLHGGDCARVVTNASRI